MPHAFIAPEPLSTTRVRLLVSNASFKWGGVHQITDQLATGLAARGHEILILCRPGSLLEQRLRGRFDLRPVARGMDFSPLAIARIASIMRAYRPDVVLTLMDKDLRLAGVAARLLGLPVVARRANDRPIGTSPYHRFVYGSIPTLHIANSNATRQTMLASAGWLAPERVHVIHNGIDANAIAAAPAARLPVPPGALVVGFLGRLEIRKGVRELLDAWAIVSAQRADAHLVIAGRGPLEAEVQERSQSLERVHYIGYRDDVPSVLQATDIVAVPSHWEGFGLIAAEAMAAGKPVVAANASSLPELVRDGEEGLLVPPGDAQSLAHAIITLCNDPNLRAAMGARARERARTAFSLERMVDEYETVLTRVSSNLR